MIRTIVCFGDSNTYGADPAGAGRLGREVRWPRVMARDLVTVKPDTSTLEAIDLMRDRGVSCLPVVQDDRLIGIITEHDFMRIARTLLVEMLAE